MITIRPFSSLGAANHGWLNAHHHFSFANYYNPQRMGWGALRVWNDDTIAPGTGFPTHPHSDMEIITYVREGAITHQDSMGNIGRTEAGDVQVMSAGSGVAHSEYNREKVPTTLFQIWIMPDEDKLGGDPSWGQKPFPKTDRSGRWTVLASGVNNSDHGGLFIRADAQVVPTVLQIGESIEYPLQQGRKGYAVVAVGQGDINGLNIQARDGVAFDEPILFKNTGTEPLELLLVDTLK